MPTLMKFEELNCSEMRQKTCCEVDAVLTDGRTRRIKCCGLRNCPWFDHSGGHVSLCWTVCMIVVMILLWYPGASFGMSLPRRHETEQGTTERGNGSRHRRAIIGDNVVSTPTRNPMFL
jgi:hypothetical protein